MRINSKDDTLKRNYIQKYQFLIKEYETVKARRHPRYRFVKEFYAANGVCAQTFLKYYGRYKNSSDDPASLVPHKRGPRYKTRRSPDHIEARVVALRERGCNRYEIHQILSEDQLKPLPSPSCVYAILKRHNLNRLRTRDVEEKRRIIKATAGELGHIDCHHLSKDMIMNDPKRRYLVCVIDSQSRIAWAEIVEDIKALTVMFAALHCFNHISHHYGIRFKEMLSDNVLYSEQSLNLASDHCHDGLSCRVCSLSYIRPFVNERSLP